MSGLPKRGLPRRVPGSRPDGATGRTRRRRLATGAALLTLVLTASGCVTVHGEDAFVPTATRAEAARALEEFTGAYNAAARALDPALDEDVLAGPFGAITQDGLRSRHAEHPGGAPKAVPLEVSDVRYLIPRRKGWPRWFVADTDTNRDRDGVAGQDTRWFFVFTRSGPDAAWRATYLSILTPDEVPALSVDGEGHPVPAPPGDLSARYAQYLQDGRGERFAPGQHTTRWRADRKKAANRPGWTTQYADEAAAGGAYRPWALRTKDGGKLVFFASRHYERRTAAPDVEITLPAGVKPLLKGAVKRSYTLEYTSNQAVVVPKSGPAVFLNRLQGVTGAQGG